MAGIFPDSPGMIIPTLEITMLRSRKAKLLWP